GKMSGVASPAGFEPATCGLEIRCCYPTELRGRDGQAFTPRSPSSASAATPGFCRTTRRSAACADCRRRLDIVSLRSFRSVRNWRSYALPNSRFDFSRDFALFVKLRGRFDTRCSRFHLLDRRCGELLLVDRFGVAGDLAQAGVTGDGRNLVRGAACLSQPASGGLAEPVCAAAVQAGGSALVAEPIAKAGSAVGLALICDEKGQVVGSRLGDDRGERRVHWDRQLDTGLKLPDLQCSIADMLPAHAHDIR